MAKLFCKWIFFILLQKDNKHYVIYDFKRLFKQSCLVLTKLPSQ